VGLLGVRSAQVSSVRLRARSPVAEGRARAPAKRPCPSPRTGRGRCATVRARRGAHRGAATRRTADARARGPQPRPSEPLDRFLVQILGSGSCSSALGARSGRVETVVSTIRWRAMSAASQFSLRVAASKSSTTAHVETNCSCGLSPLPRSAAANASSYRPRLLYRMAEAHSVACTTDPCPRVVASSSVDWINAVASGSPPRKTASSALTRVPDLCPVAAMTASPPRLPRQRRQQPAPYGEEAIRVQAERQPPECPGLAELTESRSQIA
jgi:hypothetical protein